jgi:Domain of unknown function (DUF4116)
LQYVKNQTEDICLCSVKQNGYALQYVLHQTDDICLRAVKDCGYALQYVLHQTEAICICAVKEYGLALQYVKNQTDAICLEAIDNYFKQDWWYTVQDVCDKIKYPSPQLIIRLLKLYPLHLNSNMHRYAQNIIKTYKTGSDIIVSHLVPHANNLLYKPNNVNALVSYARWHTTTSIAKTVFLICWWYIW